MILAKPDVRCSSGSPGGGTYGVLSSSDLARAMRAPRLETVACGGGAPVFTAGVSAWYPRAAAQAVSASAVTIVRILICYLLLRGRDLLPLARQRRLNGDSSCTRISYSRS